MNHCWANRLTISAVGTAGLSLIVLTTAGCATPIPSAGDSTGYLIAARYRLDAREKEGINLKLAQDFSAMRDLGFRTVFIDAPDVTHHPGVVQVAEQQDLACVFVDSSRGGDAHAHQAAVAIIDETSAPLSAQAPADVIAYRADPPFAEDGHVEIEDWLRELRVVGSVTGSHRRAIAIPAQPPSPSPTDRQLETWFLIFHAGLAAGFTDGLVFDVSQNPGQATSFPEVVRDASATYRATLKSLTARAGRWGPLLQGSRVEPIEPLRFRSSRACGALFLNARIHLLVLNPRLDRFIRGTFRVPIELAGHRFRRAVNVDSLARFEARRTEIPLSVYLRPGGAMLFELIPDTTSGGRAVPEAARHPNAGGLPPRSSHVGGRSRAVLSPVFPA